MHVWGDLVLFNATGATLLAIVVALLGLRTKRPALLHALWLVVLLKLVSFPATEVALVPRLAERLPAGESRVSVEPAATDALRDPHAATPPSAPVPLQAHSIPKLQEPATLAASERHLPVGWALFVLATTGACGVIVVAMVRTMRLHRSLRNAPAAPEEVQARVAALARRFDVTRVPKVRWVPGRMSPAVWFTRGGSEILFPSRLWDRLADPERDALLAHEIAHVRRGDPRIRWLELLVVALYWWHPVVWWARRNLRAAEEKACDALVVAKLPQSARAYVEGLLKTVEFLASGGTRASSLTTANDVSNRLKERVIMILTTKPPKPLSLRARLAVLAVAAGAILTTPAWIDPPSVALEKSPSAEVSFAREQLAIEKEMQGLEMRRTKIRLELEETQAKRQVDHRRQEILELRSHGHEEDAKQLERELERMESEMRTRREQIEWEQGHEMERSKLGFQLRETQLQLEELTASGQEAAAREVLERVKKVEQELRELDLRARRTEVERARVQLERETQDLQRMRAGE